MRDFIAKGTGNSRFLRSSIPPGTTWEEALALLADGTFPVDFAGFNAAGIAQQGTLLSAENLLSDETAAAIAVVSDDPTVDEALTKLSSDVSACAPLASPTFTGTPKAPAAATDYTTYRIRNMALMASAPSGAIGNGQLVGVYE